MKRKAKITLGQLDPEALKRPNVARYQSEEFTEQLTRALHEAKKDALRKQAAPTPAARAQA